MAQRWLSLAVAAAGVLAVLGSPAAATAGTYTWALPTAKAPGPSNPDHDSYGATPWTYQELPTATTPGAQPSFALLGTYSTTIDGGLTGWSDAVDADQPFIAANRSERFVGVVPPGAQALALQPARDRLVALAWASPLGSSQQVTVSGTFTALDSDPTCVSARPTWTLMQNTTVLASGTAPAPGASPARISATPTVDPGQTLYLVVGWTGPMYSQACVTAALTLSLSAPASSPTVTLDRPSNGSRVTDAEPAFSGQASTDFGDSPSVAVRVFKGASTTGQLVETLSAKEVGGAFSAGPIPPLPNGTYTAVAEQDDLAGDVSFSSPVTFSVHNVAPRITWRSNPVRPFTTATPVLRGLAGTHKGDSSSVTVGIWKGSVPHGDPLRYLPVKRSADGSFAVRIAPALPNGRYTAAAGQSGAGTVDGVSKPLGFTVRVPPPRPVGAVSLDRSGRASIAITCTAASGACTGDVLAVTFDSFTPVSGGPHGPVTVLFSHVEEIPAGSTELLQRAEPGYLAGFLRRHAPLRVRVSAALTDSSGKQVGGSVVRMLRLGTPAPPKRP